MICIIADNDLPSRLKVFLSRLNYIKLRLQIANYNIHESVFRLALLAMLCFPRGQTTYYKIYHRPSNFGHLAVALPVTLD